MEHCKCYEKGWWRGFVAGAVRLAVFVVIWALLLEEFGAGPATEEMRLEAVKHNAAYWHVEPDGSTEFRWNESREDE